MAQEIEIFDTTLRDGEQSPGCSLNQAEKLEVARQLERLKVDVIEAGFAIASTGDSEAIRTIAAEIKESGVAALARTKKEDIEAAAGAVRKAVRPRLHTFLATSPIHMHFKLKMTPEDVLATTRDMVAYARNLCPEVEFSAEDATRSDPEFLCRVLETAIAAGAAVVNVPDTVGYTTPEEFADLIGRLRNNVPNIDKAAISVHCHNDLGMAVANTLAAARAGASQLECTINGIGERAGNAALEEVVMALQTRRDRFDRCCRVDTRQIARTSKLVSSLIGIPVPPNKAVVGGNAFAHESGIHQHGVLANKITYEIMTPESIGLQENQIVLGKHSGRHAFEERLRRLGYSLGKEELDETFRLFKSLADKKKKISDWDLEALLMNKYWTSPEVFRLERFIINSGNTITATANIKLGRNGESREEVAQGDGPIDAAFKAVEKIVGHRFTLEDFSLRSVTAGNDAQAGVSLKLRRGERVVVGKGLSTDVVEAGLLAFLNAVNRLLGEHQPPDHSDG